MEENMSKGEPVTLINAIEVARDDLEAFKEGWLRLAALMAAAPGFRDAALHEAVSGEARFQLVNVAHWDSEQAWRDAASDPEMRAAAQQAGAADPVQARAVHHPALYRTAEVFPAST
jgi:heme oxygenase (mycobilin-producing)